MDIDERQAESQALNAALETFYHEIDKNKRTIEEMAKSAAPDRDEIIQDAKSRIAQLEERADELEEQRRRFRDSEGEYAGE